jgi:DNA-binding transcriptional ArsR family regulator
MALIDHLSTLNLRPGTRSSGPSMRPGARSSGSLTRPAARPAGSLTRPGARPAGPLAAELEEADQLVADLAALVEAGLVTVRRQLGGPVRYGPVTDLSDDAA